MLSWLNRYLEVKTFNKFLLSWTKKLGRKLMAECLINSSPKVSSEFAKSRFMRLLPVSKSESCIEEISYSTALDNRPWIARWGRMSLSCSLVAIIPFFFSTVSLFNGQTRLEWLWLDLHSGHGCLNFWIDNLLFQLNIKQVEK